MLKISKMADYAVVILAALSKAEQARCSASSLTEITGLPEPTVAKILKVLAREGIVYSMRGAGGGYLLSRSAQELSVRDIIMAMDGPISLTACVSGQKPDCSLQKSCGVRGRWDKVNQKINSALQEITLADMVVMQCTPHKQAEAVA